MGRARLNTYAQLSTLRACFTIYDLDIPHRLSVALSLGFGDLARTNLVAQIDAHIMVGNFAGLGLAYVVRVRLAFEERANLSGDGAGLKRLAIVFQNLVGDGVAGLSAQVPCKLPRGVHFHADGALAVLENVNGFLAVERKQILEMELIGADSRGIQLFDRFTNHACGGSPADQGYFGIGRPLDAWRREVLQSEGQLLHTLVHDLPANRRVTETVADQYASFVVFVGGGNVHGIGGARKRARRNAGRRKFVSLVMPVLAVHFLEQGTAIDGYVGLEALRLDRFGMFGEQKVRDDNDRALVFLREIKGFHGSIEAVGGVPGGHDDARKIALGSAINLVEIGLLLFGGNAGGRAAALDLDKNNRRFDHAGHADGLGHQGKTADGGGTHGTRAGIARADGHDSQRTLVCTLVDDE